MHGKGRSSARRFSGEEDMSGVVRQWEIAPRVTKPSPPSNNLEFQLSR